jgi:hypothetical protein
VGWAIYLDGVQQIVKWANWGLWGSEGTPGEKLLERSFSPDPFSRTFKKNIDK